MKVSRNIKHAHRHSKSELSLKEFARTLKTKGDEQASQWFVNKGPTLERKEKAARRARKEKVLAEMRAKRRDAREKSNKK